MSRESLKLHPYIDSIREIVVLWDSDNSSVQVSNRTKRRIVIEVKAKSADLEMVQVPR